MVLAVDTQPGERRYLIVSLILSFVGGFGDAGSYVLVDSFTGHVTGNSILMAIHVVKSQWLQALSCLIAVTAFLVGTAGGAMWRHPPGRSACQRLAPLLAVEFMLIAAGMFSPVLAATGGKDVFLITLCLALGLQNGALGKVKGVAFHTTFITGLSTTLVGALATGNPGQKGRLLPLIICCFILGAFAGAFAATGMGIAAFDIVLALLACTWLLAISAPAENERPGASRSSSARATP